MTSAGPLADRISAGMAGRGGPEWLAKRRQGFLEELAQSDLPSTEAEMWRYSRIEELDLEAIQVGEQPLLGEGASEGPGSERPAEELFNSDAKGLLAALGDVSGIIWTLNGIVEKIGLGEGHEVGSGISNGLLVRSLAQVGDPTESPSARALGAIARADDAVDLIAEACLADAVLVELAPGAELHKPLVVIHQVDGALSQSGCPREAGSSGVGGLPAVFPRLVVSLGEGPRLALVEMFVSLGAGQSLVMPVAELELGFGAVLDYVSFQDLSEVSWVLSKQSSSIAGSASFTSFSVALGGHYARVRTDSAVKSSGADSKLMALYLATGDQMHDFRTYQDHVGPRTTSDLVFKGAVDGNGHSVYSGMIKVRKGANGSRAFQTNRNLVLSEGAHADSVPNLDIEENDVRCSHASAVGPVDPEQIFYLESRGIDPDEAERLVVLGFFKDLITRSPITGLSGVLEEAIAAKLAASSADGPIRTVGMPA